MDLVFVLKRVKSVIGWALYVFHLSGSILSFWICHHIKCTTRSTSTPGSEANRWIERKKEERLRERWKCNCVFLLAGPSQDVFLLPYIPLKGKEVVSFLYITRWSYLSQPFWYLIIVMRYDHILIYNYHSLIGIQPGLLQLLEVTLIIFRSARCH